jgi:hypothetical protein
MWHPSQPTHTPWSQRESHSTRLLAIFPALAVAVLIYAEVNAEMEHQTAMDTTEGLSKPMGQRGGMLPIPWAGRRNERGWHTPDRGAPAPQRRRRVPTLQQRAEAEAPTCRTPGAHSAAGWARQTSAGCRLIVYNGRSSLCGRPASLQQACAIPEVFCASDGSRDRGRF